MILNVEIRGKSLGSLVRISISRLGTILCKAHHRVVERLKEARMVICRFCNKDFELIQGDTIFIEDTPNLLISTPIKVIISCPRCEREEVIP